MKKIYNNIKGRFASLEWVISSQKVRREKIGRCLPLTLFMFIPAFFHVLGFGVIAYISLALSLGRPQKFVKDLIGPNIDVRKQALKKCNPATWWDFQDWAEYFGYAGLVTHYQYFIAHTKHVEAIMQAKYVGSNYIDWKVSDYIEKQSVTDIIVEEISHELESNVWELLLELLTWWHLMAPVWGVVLIAVMLNIYFWPLLYFLKRYPLP